MDFFWLMTDQCVHRIPRQLTATAMATASSKQRDGGLILNLPGEQLSTFLCFSIPSRIPLVLRTEHGRKAQDRSEAEKSHRRTLSSDAAYTSVTACTPRSAKGHLCASERRNRRRDRTHGPFGLLQPRTTIETSEGLQATRYK